MPQSHKVGDVRIGQILAMIRQNGNCVKNDSQRKQWLLERGVILSYESGKSSVEEKWDRYKVIFSVYYSEKGHLKIPQSYEYQDIKIGIILSQIKSAGNFVRDNPERKQWLLERGVSFTYDL